MKKSKKGYTIVELVIVIVVILVLVAVLLPTIFNIVNNPNNTTDMQLVRELNIAVSAELNKNHKSSFDTAYEAFAACEEYGYKVDRIVCKSTMKIAYDSKKAKFVLFNEEANKATLPISEEESLEYEINDEDKIFLYVVRKVENTSTYTYNGPYSVYCGSIFSATTVNINGVSFDAGNNDSIKYLNYKSSSANDVTIRTNGGTLVVDTNAAGNINHFASLNVLDVEKCGKATYHENGNVVYANIAAGKISFESNSSIEALHFEATGTEVAAGSTYDTFENITISYASNVEQPDYSRDSVRINPEGTKVCTLSLPSETNNIYLTKQGVYEQVKVEEASSDGTALGEKEWVNTSDATNETKTASEQISNNFNGSAVINVGGEDVNVTLEITGADSENGERNIVVKSAKDSQNQDIADTSLVEQELNNVLNDQNNDIVENTGKSSATAQLEAFNILSYVTEIKNTPSVKIYNFSNGFNLDTVLFDSKKLDAAYKFSAFNTDAEYAFMRDLLDILNIDDDSELAKLTASEIDERLNTLPETADSETLKAMIKLRMEYFSWNCDFVVSFDKDVAANSVALAGQYDSYSEDYLGFGLPNNISKDTDVRLLQTAFDGLGKNVFKMTYAQICGWVQIFNCGIVNLSDDNIGTTVTVSLKLYEVDENGVETGKELSASLIQYTFEK